MLESGTVLHIVVLTLRCNQNCIYCQASRRKQDDKGYDMSISTARKVVDLIFESPSDDLTIEFQGGEPLLNFNTLKFIVEYSRSKSKDTKKKATITLVSNLLPLTEDMLDFLIKNNVRLCTSLDGPKHIHDYNRPLRGENSHGILLEKIKLVKSKYRNVKTRKRHKLDAIQTTTNKTLKYPKELVDEYVKNDFDSIFIRPLSPLGIAGTTYKRIGYSSDDFLKFYKEALYYIIDINLGKKQFAEGYAQIFLSKILGEYALNYMDLRSPCGAVIGELAYNYNGEIYTCDEGRMLSEMGDKRFQIGHVNNSKWIDLILHETTGYLCASSCIESIPGCDDCVYSPYCGVCPILNVVEQNNVFGQIPTNTRCRINKGILNILFELIKINDIKIMKVFRKWVDNI